MDTRITNLIKNEQIISTPAAFHFSAVLFSSISPGIAEARNIYKDSSTLAIFTKAAATFSLLYIRS